jgi:muramoyltetrapeptide carboxypeptidase
VSGRQGHTREPLPSVSMGGEPVDDEVVRGPVLRPGDVVSIVSPSGPARRQSVEAGVALLRSWGLCPRVAPHADARRGYLAGPDSQRAADVNAALADPEVRAVICTRGGYGSQRIADVIDTTAARRDPKPVVGFSDVTALHLALWRGARLACLYGPGAAWRGERTGAVSAQSLRDALMTTGPVLLKRDEGIVTAPVTMPGSATGRLIGGNLCLLASSLGTCDAPDTSGAILLLEDVDEPPYKVDRMLTQLRRAGALTGLAGVALGQFTRCGDDASSGIPDVLADRLGDLGVPVLGGLPVGHGADQLTVPVGVTATLDTTAGLLTVSPALR